MSHGRKTLNAEIAKIAEFGVRFDGGPAQRAQRGAESERRMNATGISSFIRRSDFGLGRRFATPSNRCCVSTLRVLRSSVVVFLLGDLCDLCVDRRDPNVLIIICRSCAKRQSPPLSKT